MCSTVGGVQYRGGYCLNTVGGYHDKCGGYLEYHGGVLGDIMSTMGVILSTVGMFNTLGDIR